MPAGSARRAFAREAPRHGPTTWDDLVRILESAIGRNAHDNIENDQGPPGARLARPADGRGGRRSPRRGPSAGDRTLGASTGRHEALELRDTDDPRYGGLGVTRAVDNVIATLPRPSWDATSTISPALDATLIALDGTPNKSRLGANAVLGVSLAVAHAAAAARGEELFVHFNRLWRSNSTAGHGRAREPALPMPMVNMISGGLHAGGNLDIQDVLIIPVGASKLPRGPGDDRRHVSRRRPCLKEQGLESTLVGDEGGYGPRLRNNEQAFEIVVDAMLACGFEPGRDVAIAVDVASTHFFDPAARPISSVPPATRRSTATGMIDLLARWVERYPIVSIEDGLAEDDWAAGPR